MSLMSPLNNRIIQLTRQAANEAVALIEVRQDVQAIIDLITPMIDAVEILIRGIIEILERAQYAERKMAEFDPTYLPDKLADLQLMVKHLEMVGRLEYIDIATRLDVVDPDLLDAVFRELLSLPSGPQKVAAIKMAIEKLEGKNGTTE